MSLSFMASAFSVPAQQETTSVSAQASEAPVGIGVHELSYYDQSFAMADLVRQSQFRTTGFSETVSVDASGMPTVDFLLLITGKELAAGTYKLKFTGQASISVASTPGGSVTNKVYDAGTNTTTADIVFPSVISGNCWLTFTSTRRTAQSSAADGLSGLWIWRPGYPTDGSAEFTSEFIAAMRKFHVIRAMDMTVTNLNPSVTWTDRTKPGFFGLTGVKGQPWETIVALANAADRDIWLNLPAKADDDYINKLALLVKYGSDGSEPYTSTQANPVHPPLKSNLKVYVEYGNEIWNSGPGFACFGWALALSDANRMNTSHPIAFDGAVTDQYQGFRRWIAYRSAFISLAFRNVFGDSDMMIRVRPIFSTQVGNANEYLAQGLIWAAAYYGDTSSIWYGGGGAAYYDSSSSPTDTNPVTMAAYFNGLPALYFGRAVATDTIWTMGFGLKNVAYEGGPGPGGSALGSTTGSVDLCYAYNNDARMKRRMLAAHRVWQENGGDLLTFYVYSMSAAWSFVNGSKKVTASDSTSTKFTAVDLIRAAPKATPTLGTAVPGTVYLRATTANVRYALASDGSWKYSGTAYRMLGKGTNTPVAQWDFLLVPIRTVQAGTYKLSLNTYDATAAGRVEVMVNGTLAGTVAETPGAAGQVTQSSEIDVYLPDGISVLKLRTKAGSEVWVKDVVVRV